MHLQLYEIFTQTLEVSDESVLADNFTWDDVAAARNKHLDEMDNAVHGWADEMYRIVRGE
jgi:hypothetical protein